MITVEFTFPWGRYHATAWDRSANEVAPDWPPSPWRILRALYASWRWHEPDLDEDLVHGLLSKLASAPRYQLPAFQVAHTRHYYPDAAHLAGVTTKTDKTLDVFVVTERGAALTVQWNAEIDATERAALSRILEGVAYLGRADALVEARLVSSPEHDTRSWLEPGRSDATPETIRLLTPDSPLDIDALTTRPVDLRKRRQPRPSATHWTSYAAPSPTPTALRPARRRKSSLANSPIAIRFALTGDPVRVHEAVALGDALRRSCLRAFGGSHETVEPALAGKHIDGQPVRGPHGHAHFLSISTRGNPSHVDTMVVWVPDGLSERALRSVAQVHELHSAQLDRPWLGKEASPRKPTVAVEAMGPVHIAAPELCGPARVWRSLTPFALTRHHRSIDTAFVADNVTRELRHRDLPEPIGVDVRRSDALAYRRRRPNRGRDRRAFKLEIHFDKPVDGPLSLGHLSHFGLGLFAPHSHVS